MRKSNKLKKLNNLNKLKRLNNLNKSKTLNNKVADSWSSNLRTNCSILITLVAVLGWFCIEDIGLMVSSGDWRTTDAIIIVSKVKKGSSNPLRGSSSPTPWVEFSYLVGGHMYVSDELDFGQWSYDVPRYLNNYPIGKQVTIYYDPDKPKQAVLNKTGSYLANFFGLFLFWGAGAVIFYYRFMKREKD